MFSINSNGSGPKIERAVSFTEGISGGNRNTSKQGVKATGYVNKDLRDQIILNRDTADVDLDIVGQRFVADVDEFYQDLKQNKPEEQRLIRVGRDLLRLRPVSVANYSLSESTFAQSLANALNRPAQQSIYAAYLHQHGNHHHANNKLHAEYQRHYTAHEINEFIDKLAEFKSLSDHPMDRTEYIKQCLHQGTSFADSSSDISKMTESSSVKHASFIPFAQKSMGISQQPPFEIDISSSEPKDTPLGLKRSTTHKENLFSLAENSVTAPLSDRKPAESTPKPPTAEQSNKQELDKLVHSMLSLFEAPAPTESLQAISKEVAGPKQLKRTEAVSKGLAAMAEEIPDQERGKINRPKGNFFKRLLGLE